MYIKKIVETEKDATTNKVVMSRSSSFKIDYCPDSPNNLENTQIQYLTPDHKIVTPKESTGLAETKTMGTDELFPKFLPLPTCTIPFKNKTYMVFAYHENDVHDAIPRSISLANTSLARQNRRRNKEEFDSRDDNNDFVSDSDILRFLEKIPSSLCLPSFEDE